MGISWFGQNRAGGYRACAAAFRRTKKRAVEVFTRFVEAGLGEKSQDDYYRAVEGDCWKRRIPKGGKTPRRRAPTYADEHPNAQALTIC